MADAERPPEAAQENPVCAHHWLIETPMGESSQGRCKMCGQTREFLNYSTRKMLEPRSEHVLGKAWRAYRAQDNAGSTIEGESNGD